MIQERFKVHSKVSDYALELSISQRKLQKVTEAVLGKSPKQLIIECLILENKRLLVHGTISIKEIGYHLGFDEPSNFTKF
ncbi:Helix-turn-helix domain-containing protein [Pedobacter steynii]|uniref:Helix-turn-helix domain-containing protein n=1 Tax=Pedobacter steynii TaxID=430522 RepID=A0A1G9P8K3_9SPHI|nr:helix-turn-helix domain-containing protein [Pedobacter steynii]NQX39059.1 helix-turn-helix domain-containing protein [Pedobacter steynii]SDL95116.1 Helix-turn-helix domain-containing protein [Pedobacter steynii]